MLGYVDLYKIHMVAVDDPLYRQEVFECFYALQSQWSRWPFRRLEDEQQMWRIHMDRQSPPAWVRWRGEPLNVMLITEAGRKSIAENGKAFMLEALREFIEANGLRIKFQLDPGTSQRDIKTYIRNTPGVKPLKDVVGLLSVPSTFDPLGKIFDW